MIKILKLQQNPDNHTPCGATNQRTSKIRRSDNFSTAETEALLRLIKRNQDIIESKKTDRITSEAKNRTWEEISLLFNKHFGTARTAKSLRHKYDNHKRNRFRKKNMHLHLPPYSAAIEKSGGYFEDILGDPLQGDFVDFDDDPDFSTKSSPSATGESAENMPVEEITHVENIKVELVEEDTNSWSNAAPELRPSNPHPSRNSEDNSLPKRDGKLTELMQEKLDYVKLQKQLLLEEHQLKLKHMKELHEKQMVDVDLSIELKRKQLSN